MVAVSTSWRSRFIAQVCRSMCGVMPLDVSDGHAAAAVATWRSTRRRTASRLSRFALRPREEGVARRPTALVEPTTQHRPRLAPQRGDALLAPLAVAAHVGAGAETDVGAREPGELADPQPGLQGEKQEGVSRRPIRVAPSGASSSAAASSSVR